MKNATLSENPLARFDEGEVASAQLRIGPLLCSRAMMLVMIVGGMVQMAVGADTHDYSTYAKLKADTTVQDGYPTSDKWDPASDMANGGYYIIPSGRTLTTKTGSAPGYGTGGMWLADEIAIAGTFAALAKSSRNYVATTPKLALLAGGKISLSTAYGTINGGDSGTIDIRGTADNPSCFTYSYDPETDKDAYHAKVTSVLTASDPEAVVKFSSTVAETRAFQRAFRVWGFSSYLGSVVVDGTNTWLRPETTATEFTIGGTLSLTNGGSFYVAAVSPTVGTLKIGSGSVFRVAKGCAITVNQAVELDEGARIQIENPFGDWEKGTPKEAVKIATFGASAARPTDYRTIFEVVPPSNAVGGVPDIVFTETANGDGSVDVSVSYREIVTFTGDCKSGNTPFSSSPSYTMLSDGNPISGDKDYYACGKNIYVEKTDIVFTGHSLTVVNDGAKEGKLAVYSGCKFTCTNLYLAGSRICQQKAAQWARFDGNIYAQGGKVSFAGAAGVEIMSDIHGSSDLKMYRYGDTADENFAKTSHVYLKGDNSDFAGRFLFGELSWTGGETNHVSELHVWKKANLGGAMPEVTSNGVTVADTCSLVYNGGAETFDEETRGWTFEGASGLNLVSNVAVKVLNTITVAGTLTKRGVGTLVATDVDGAELVIEAGGLGAASTEAFGDLATLTFAAGTRFVVNASADGSLKAAGADFSATALTVPAGGVPVGFTDIPENGANITVATFATAEDAAKFIFVKPRGYIVKRSVEEVDGKFVLKADIEKSGIMLIVR